MPYKNIEDRRKAIMRNYYKYKDKYKLKKATYYKQNKEKINKRNNNWRKLNPEKVINQSKTYSNTHKDQIKIRHQTWYKDNKDRVLSNCKKYRARNLDKIKKYLSNYKKTHKELYRCYGRTHRARKKNVIETFTLKEWKELKEKSMGICVTCNRYVGIDQLTLDHIYPLYLASRDFKITGVKRIYTINDIRPLCGRCNYSKRYNVKA